MSMYMHMYVGFLHAEMGLSRYGCICVNVCECEWLDHSV